MTSRGSSTGKSAQARDDDRDRELAPTGYIWRHRRASQHAAGAGEDPGHDQEQHLAQNVAPTPANTDSRFRPGLAWPAVTAIAQDNASKDAIAFPFLVTRSGLGARRYGGTPDGHA